MAIATNAGLWASFPLLRPLVPARYAPAYPIVLVLLAAVPAQLISYLVTPLANAYEGLLPRIVVVSFGIAVLNVVGDLLLVPKIGIMGAAIATTSAFSLGALLQIAVIRCAGITFPPLWRYGVPSLSLIPTLILLQRTSVSMEVGLIAVAAVGAMLASLWGDIRQFFGGTAVGAVAALLNALTLSETGSDVALSRCDGS